MAPRPESTEAAIGLPPEQAIKFFRQKVNVGTQRWTDLWNEAHSRGFMVAGAASQALVADFRTAVAKAIEQGTTLAEFRRDFDSIVEKHGWVHNGSAAWRSQIIYETNLSMAYSAGRYAQMADPDVLQVYPYWQYQHTSSLHPRPQHLAWVGTTLRADDPWWSTHYPPNGWRCRCSVRPVSDAGLRRQGKTGPDTAPPVDMRPFRIPHSDRVVEVPHGIDPGFGYNPGAAWLGETPAGATPPPLAPPPAPPIPRPSRLPPAEAVEAPVGKPAAPSLDLPGFLVRPSGRVIVGELAPELARAIEPIEEAAASRPVLLSEDTLEKQRERHPDITSVDYEAVRALLRQPAQVLRQDERRLVLLGHEHQGRRLAAFVKSVPGRDERYLVSLRRARIKDVLRLLRLYEAIKQGEEGAPEGPPANPS